MEMLACLEDGAPLWDHLQDSPQRCKLTKLPPPDDKGMQAITMVQQVVIFVCYNGVPLRCCLACAVGTADKRA